MRRASGGAATTNTTSAERNHGSRLAQPREWISRRVASGQSSRRAFFGVSAVLFAASAAVMMPSLVSHSAVEPGAPNASVSISGAAGRPFSGTEHYNQQPTERRYTES